MNEELQTTTKPIIITKAEILNGKSIRAFQENETTFIPLSDISKLFHTCRSNLSKITSAPPLDVECKDFLIQTSGGGQTLKCITKKGADLIGFKLQFRHLRDKSPQGYIYILSGLCNGKVLYKIGKSRKQTERPYYLLKQSILPMEIVCVIKCEDMHKSERRLHKFLEQYHIHHEYFSIPLLDINAITKEIDGKICIRNEVKT
jgi:hypothetical protein